MKTKPTNNQKKWWSPLWSGLVIDQKGKHYQNMGNAIWLFLYFILNAERATGTLRRKIQTICDDTGITRDTITRWMNMLKDKKYIAVKNTGRYLLIRIHLWKTFSGIGNIQHQMSEISNTRCW